MVIFLILHDFIKAIFLLVFPATVMANIEAYDDLKFCKVSAFFTAFAIEGSDIAILSFAIHVALLVYRPNNRINEEIIMKEDYTDTDIRFTWCQYCFQSC